MTTCLALLVAFVLALGDFSTSDRSDLFVDVPTSADLKPGAPVKVAGVPCGKVRDVSYHGGSEDDAVGRRVWVRVHLRLDPDKLVTIREDASFWITTQGVLGEKYVEIDPGTPEAPSLKAGAVVVGEPPLRLEIMAWKANRLLTAFAKVVEDNEDALAQILDETRKAAVVLRRTGERIDGILADNREDLDAAIDKLLEVETEARELLSSARVAMGDGTSLQRTVAHVEKVTRDLKTTLPPVVSEVRGALDRYSKLADTGTGAVDEARVAALAALEDAKKALSNVATLTDEIKRGRGSVGAFLSDEEVYDEIREMLRDLKRHPWKFIWKE